MQFSTVAKETRKITEGDPPARSMSLESFRIHHRDRKIFTRVQNSSRYYGNSGMDDFGRCFTTVVDRLSGVCTRRELPIGAPRSRTHRTPHVVRFISLRLFPFSTITVCFGHFLTYN